MPVYKSSEKTADGRQWIFQVSYTVGGKHKNYRSKKYGTKKEAEMAEAAFLLSNGKAAPDRITFDQIISEYLAEKKTSMKPQSWLRAKVLCGHVSAVLGDVCISSMTKADFDNFRRRVAENASWSVSYKNKVLNHAKALITFADKHHDITNRIPWKYEPLADTVRAKQTMQFFTKEEFDRFIEAVDDLRYRALFTVLFYCGLRVGEANALQWRDLDRTNRTLSVSKTVSTKLRMASGGYLITSPKTAGSVRTIPYSSKVGELLDELYAFWCRYDGFSDEWFVFGGLFNLPETSITKVKDKCIKKAGLKTIRIHDFRHSCASYYIHLGCSPIVLAKLLGHSSAKMTLDTYSHFYTSDLRELVEKAE